ncbi:MAG: BrnT family toxin [Rhizobiales bacterium]|nr:BrnT family toxin [Hyphomicrobiales bacterium]
MPAIEFDAAKDKANVSKHGISLSRAADMKVLAILQVDGIDYGETRYRAFGMIDDRAHCLVFTERSGAMRIISLRRAHEKEIARYVKTQGP